MIIVDLPPKQDIIIQQLHKQPINMKKNNVLSIDNNILVVSSEQWQNAQNMLKKPFKINKKMQNLFDRGFKVVNQQT